MRFFHHSPPLRDAITESLRELTAEKNKLQIIAVRIQQRDRILFDLCVTATRNRNSQKATLFANELSELRKAAETLYKSQLAVEQFLLRLETIRELGDFLNQLKPAVDIMSDIKNQISGIMPEVAEKLGSVNNELGNAIAMMSSAGDLSEAKLTFLTSGELAEKVINEASQIVEERIRAELPEVPQTRAASERELAQEIKMEEIALALDGWEFETKIASSYIKVESVEPVKFNVFQPENENLKEQIYSYAKRNKGEINVSRCAKELSIKCDDVLEILNLLCKENKIKY